MSDDRIRQPCSDAFGHIQERLGAIQATSEATLAQARRTNGHVAQLYRRTDGHGRQIDLLEAAVRNKDEQLREMRNERLADRRSRRRWAWERSKTAMDVALRVAAIAAMIWIAVFQSGCAWNRARDAATGQEVVSVAPFWRVPGAVAASRDGNRRTGSAAPSPIMAADDAGGSAWIITLAGCAMIAAGVATLTLRSWFPVIPMSASLLAIGVGGGMLFLPKIIAEAWWVVAIAIVLTVAVGLLYVLGFLDNRNRRISPASSPPPSPRPPR